MKFRSIYMIAAVITASVFFTACSKGKDDDFVANAAAAGTAAKVPTLTVTDAAGGITNTSANTGGTIALTGGANITAAGVCWSTSTLTPTTADSKTDIGPSTTGGFITTMTGLTPNTLYYVRAYATNSSGTAYAPRMSFTTLP